MRIAALLAVCALLVAGCGDETDDPDEGSQAGPDLDGRTFIATSITDDGADRLLVGGTELRISFDDGQLGISAGCNQMGGDYDLDGGQLTVGGLSMTAMGCDPQRMAQDTWVSGLFEAPVGVSLTGDQLQLTSGKVVLQLTDREVASPDAALEGTTWVLDGLISGEAVSSVPGGVTASLVITNGRASIDSGCNAMMGDVAVDGPTMTFGPLASTKMKCSGARAEVEEAVAKVLNGSVVWVINEHSMTVMNGDNGLAFRVA